MPICFTAQLSGKSERTILILTSWSLVPLYLCSPCSLRGLTARLVLVKPILYYPIKRTGLTARTINSSCPVCLSFSVDRFFLIQVIDVSVLTECTDLGLLIQANGNVFLPGLQVEHFWGACNECGMWDYLPMAKPLAVSHLGIHYNCCLAYLLTGC